jgi:hypothetical protein
MKTKSLLIAARLSMIIGLMGIFISCNKSVLKDEDLGPYNIDVTLHTLDSKGDFNAGYGFIKFRQDPDTARIITLDTWVFNLAPNHDYILERAVNPITDNDCTSTSWLQLGKGLVAQTIHTDFKGDGMENLFRDITSIARGTQFKIHFQIIDASTLATVLVSDCDQYTVR